MNILETKDLHKDFNGLQILFGVNLQIRQGERHAIIGPNGAGKTTLFNVITGTYKPSKGKVYFNGKDISGYESYKLVHLGMGRSFQINSTFSAMSVFENVRLAVMSKRRKWFDLFHYADKMKDITAETEDILERIGLMDVRNVPAGTLSYGRIRALEVSLALATNPSLVFLDEFAAGMSREETHTAVALVRKLTERRTAVIIEHDMDVVFSLADRITVLHYGQILATGAPEEIRQNQDVKDAYLGNMKV
jgi:branched-chain amino acid transport system ATP-binding protein